MPTNQLKAGALLNYVIIGLNAFVGLVYTPYMLHKLGQSEYGLYSLVGSVIAYLTLMDFGFGNAVVRYTAKYRAEGKHEEMYRLFGMFFLIYAIISLLGLGGGLALYFNVDAMFGDTMTSIELERAKVMMLILTFNLVFTFLFQIYGSIVTAFESFVFLKGIQIVRIIIQTLIMVLVLSIGYKAVAMVVVVTFFNLATLISNYIYCKSKIKIKIKFGYFDKSLLKEIAVYSFWIFLNLIMNKVYWSTGQFVLGAVSGTIAVSVFSVAILLEGMYMNFSTAIASVFLPRVTSMVASHKSDKEISDLFVRTGRVQYIIMSFVLSGFLVFGLPFIHIWAGYEYTNAYYISVMFFVSLLIPLIQNLGITILQARNQMKFRSLLYLAISVISLLGQIVLSKMYGEVGCAIAISLALLIGQGLIMNIYYRRRQHLDIKQFWIEIGKMSVFPVFITIIGLVILRYIHIDSWFSLAIGVVVFTLVYAPLFWHFSMSQYEKELMNSLVKKVYHKA